jgi:hypothetical protein
MKRTQKSILVWLALSALLHCALVFLPIDVLDAIFPRGTPVPVGTPADLVPDFADLALAVIQLGSPTDRPDLDRGRREDLRAAADLMAGIDLGTVQPDRGLESGARQETAETPELDFPPVPRLIIPPALDDLGVRTLSLTLRILVADDGKPVRVVVPDSLAGTRLGKRIAGSAMRFRFEPAKRGALPVEAWVELPLELEASGHR